MIGTLNNCSYVNEEWQQVKQPQDVLQCNELIDKCDIQIDKTCSEAECRSMFRDIQIDKTCSEAECRSMFRDIQIDKTCSEAEYRSMCRDQVVHSQCENVVISSVNMMDLEFSQLGFVLIMCIVQTFSMAVLLNEIDEVNKNKDFDTFSSNLKKLVIVELSLFLFVIISVFVWNFHWFPLLSFLPIISGIILVYATTKDIKKLDQDEIGLASMSFWYHFIFSLSFLLALLASFVKAIYTYYV